MMFRRKEQWWRPDDHCNHNQFWKYLSSPSCLSCHVSCCLLAPQQGPSMNPKISWPETGPWASHTKQRDQQHPQAEALHAQPWKNVDQSIAIATQLNWNSSGARAETRITWRKTHCGNRKKCAANWWICGLSGACWQRKWQDGCKVCCDSNNSMMRCWTTPHPLLLALKNFTQIEVEEWRCAVSLSFHDCQGQGTSYYTKI